MTLYISSNSGFKSVAYYMSRTADRIKKVYINKKDTNICCGNCSVTCSTRMTCCDNCSGQRNKLPKALFMDKYTLIPHFDNIDRFVCHVIGVSGSGKSTFASALARNYITEGRGRVAIFCPTNVVEDPAYEDLKICQFAMDNSLLDIPFNIEKDIGVNNLIIFDDCGSVKNGNVTNKIIEIITSVLETGRKHNISLIITSHAPQVFGRRLSNILSSETHYHVVFPQGNDRPVSKFLNDIIKIDKNKMKNTDGEFPRWVVCHQNYPKYIMSEKYVKLLS